MGWGQSRESHSGLNSFPFRLRLAKMREVEAAQGQAGKVPPARRTLSFWASGPCGPSPWRPAALINSIAYSTNMHWAHVRAHVLGTPRRTVEPARSGPARRAPAQPCLPPSSGDETYLDIFRDFSLMASDDPEKLSRRSHDLHTL